MSIEIDPGWLGHYGAGDSWEGGARSIRLWRDADDTVRFAYQYESRGNHGYSVASKAGVVVEVSATAITVEITSESSSAWEDLFKEHVHDQTSTPHRSVIPIERLEDGKPVLSYGADLRWRSARER